MLNHMINKVREVRDAFHIAYCFILIYPVNTGCVYMFNECFPHTDSAVFARCREEQRTAPTAC